MNRNGAEASQIPACIVEWPDEWIHHAVRACQEHAWQRYPRVSDTEVLSDDGIVDILEFFRAIEIELITILREARALMAEPLSIHSLIDSPEKWLKMLTLDACAMYLIEVLSGFAHEGEVFQISTMYQALENCKNDPLAVYDRYRSTYSHVTSPLGLNLMLGFCNTTEPCLELPADTTGASGA